jgi:SAM-dependent methyltransferase
MSRKQLSLLYPGVLLLLLLALVAPAALAQEVPEEKLAPFVPSPEMVVQKMLELANVKPGDVVYDLGCGDGRIIIMAAQKFGANAVGVELDDDLYKTTSGRIKELKLQDKVKIIHGDLLKVDLSPATVVTLYLLTSANEKLKPNLEKYLRKGARVVCHDYKVPGWTPEKTENLGSEQNEVRHHTIYLYRR